MDARSILRQANMNRRRRHDGGNAAANNAYAGDGEEIEYINLIEDEVPDAAHAALPRGPNVGIEWEEDWLHDAPGSHPDNFHLESCPNVDDDGQDTNMVTFETIAAEDKMRLRINGVLYCFDVRTLKTMLLDSELDENDVPILKEPFTGYRFSAAQVQRIQNHPTPLDPSMLAERERRRRERQEEEEREHLALAIAFGDLVNNGAAPVGAVAARAAAAREPAAIRRQRLAAHGQAERQRVLEAQQIAAEAARVRRLHETMDTWQGCILRMQQYTSNVTAREDEMFPPPQPRLLVLHLAHPDWISRWRHLETRYHWLRKRDDHVSFENTIVRFLIVQAPDALTWLVRNNGLLEHSQLQPLPASDLEEPTWVLPNEVSAERRAPGMGQFQPLNVQHVLQYIQSNLLLEWLPFHLPLVQHGQPAGVRRTQIRTIPDISYVQRVCHNVRRVAITCDAQFARADVPVTNISSKIVVSFVKKMFEAQDQFIAEARLHLPQDVDEKLHDTDAQKQKKRQLLRDLSQVRRLSNNVLEVILDSFFDDEHAQVDVSRSGVAAAAAAAAAAMVPPAAVVARSHFSRAEQVAHAEVLYKNIMLKEFAPPRNADIGAVRRWLFNTGACQLLIETVPLSNNQRTSLIMVLLKRLEFEENKQRVKVCERVIDAMQTLELESGNRLKFDAHQTTELQQSIQRLQLGSLERPAAAAAAVQQPAKVTLERLTYIFQKYVVQKQKRDDPTVSVSGHKHSRNKGSGASGNSASSKKKPRSNKKVVRL